MLIVGERINTTRKQINEAVDNRDASFIQSDVKAQVEAGANLIDVNAGSRVGSEIEDMLWLIEVIQDVTSARLCLDSSDPHCLEEAIRRVRGSTMLNSTSLEKRRFESMVPVIREREVDIVALCLDDEGIPKSLGKVMENAKRLVEDLENIGVKRERIYLDPLVQAVSTNMGAGPMVVEAIERIHQEFPGVKTICGLSNISFALPIRPLINRTFLTLAMKAGLTAAIIDPLDKKLAGTLKATALLLDQDAYCKDYIKAYREGRLEG
jgi:5-methyltetrahydrofolate--homocysteine methyltransferase